MRPANLAHAVRAIQGMRSGAFLTAGAKMCLNAYMQAYAKRNHASTGVDDLFGDFTICS